mmetsp:Transcript_646/g.2001  ORF Transcript_646/g.2001 Transcript_646/m.2001 type:complete len:145 (+) Transcript_646:835-1269(+)
MNTHERRRRGRRRRIGRVVTIRQRDVVVCTVRACFYRCKRWHDDRRGESRSVAVELRINRVLHFTLRCYGAMQCYAIHFLSALMAFFLYDSKSSAYDVAPGAPSPVTSSTLTFSTLVTKCSSWLTKTNPPSNALHASMRALTES